MKKIVLISTFCDNDEKQNVLYETVEKIKELGLDVMMICPNFLPIKQEIIQLCDFTFFTKENPLLTWPVRQYTHWFEIGISENRICTFHEGHTDYGWAALYQTKKLSQIALTFDYDIFHHIIYDLKITDEVIEKLLNEELNVIYPRKNPKNPNEIWDENLHLMTFDRQTFEKIEKEITLKNYLSDSGFAEGEVKKWREKFNLKVSNLIIEDRIFYWDGHEFFNYSPFSDFKLFISKNEKTKHMIGEVPNHREQELTDNIRLTFYGFSVIEPVEIEINGIKYIEIPKNWEYIELPISSQNVNSLVLTYKGKSVDLSEKYKKIPMNQIYYNYK